jgi:hypothetical protein
MHILLNNELFNALQMGGIDLYSDNHTIPINTLHWQHAELMVVKAGVRLHIVTTGFLTCSTCIDLISIAFLKYECNRTLK